MRPADPTEVAVMSLRGPTLLCLLPTLAPRAATALDSMT